MFSGRSLQSQRFVVSTVRGAEVEQQHCCSALLQKTLLPAVHRPVILLFKLFQICKSQQDEGLMADKESTGPVCEEEDERDLNYQPPAQKSLQEIQELDKEDESLNKYKQTLLGSGPVVSDPSVPNVQVTRLTLMCDQAPGPITMDLKGDLDALKKQNFTMKEGVDYRVKIHFKVNKEIVSGLKYVHLTYRKGIRVDKAVYMVGSYGPRVEEHEFITPVEEAPKGMIVRGTYHIKSYFTDDDKTDHLSWEWNLQIKKDWDSTE
ncbi:rho GDP-dissociation inhibitor 3 isoform X1 [Silurus meridionalis]|uniref:rho GDP-dissociation inhibitor 3 isoform X1 n=1 Tax=Silurus meridionalis TaxID=175797 RepID=UPI001EEB51D2|nr:rho GDP-dissociation inhibitor 3 isoform X1 [Silurus meridionalis]